MSSSVEPFTLAFLSERPATCTVQTKEWSAITKDSGDSAKLQFLQELVEHCSRTVQGLYGDNNKAYQLQLPIWLADPLFQKGVGTVGYACITVPDGVTIHVVKHYLPSSAELYPYQRYTPVPRGSTIFNLTLEDLRTALQLSA